MLESNTQQKLNELQHLIVEAQKLLNKIPEISDKLSVEFQTKFQQLSKHEYHIGVIGTEKAGKSTLLNGLLGVNLLPSFVCRTSYTTTEIHITSVEKQRIEVEYYTIEEFNQTVDRLKISLNEFEYINIKSYDYDLLKYELEYIEKYSSKISQYLNQPIKILDFNDISEIKDELKESIANPSTARAVKKVAIYLSNSLNIDKNQIIVFHDIPDFDSPITSYKEQADKKLGEIDSILYAKDFSRPSLTFPEVSVLKQNDFKNPKIKIAQKTIVTLTRFDCINKKSDYEKILNEAYDSWEQQCNGLIPKNKIIPVCAVLEIQDWDETQEIIDFFKENVANLNGGNSGIQDLKDIILNSMNDTFIERIQSMKQLSHQIIMETLNYYSNEIKSIEKTLKI